MRRYYLNSYFDFGKYKNQTIENVVLKDINYIIWCIMEIEDLIFHNDVIELIQVQKDKILADNNLLTHILNKENREIIDQLENNKIINIINTNNLKINISKIRNNK